jgi:prepilin-type N-terminal cleavage/methylation domain-containing protein
MKVPKTHSRNGLTLLELLTALVLASLMMSGVVGVLRQMKQKSKQIDQLDLQPAWESRLVSLITHDLQNSRRISVNETSITLTGYMGRDFNTGQATHRPTQVRYFARQTEENAWLLREEQHIDVRSTENTQTEVVCYDTRSLTIERLEEGTLRLATPLRQPTNQVFVTIPARLRISLFDVTTPSKTVTPQLQTEVFLR